MINIKNIAKVLLVALFVCVYSGNVWAEDKIYYGSNRPTPEIPASDRAKDAAQSENVKVGGAGGPNQADFCSSNLGIFSDLVKTGQTIFNRLRDLIYVVAGFGIIAVAVGGFFGNLNWKWLGAIVISLVVIATAGELIVLLTGCEQFSGSLITNTLKEPTPMVGTDGKNPYTDTYNAGYTEESPATGPIRWSDSMDKTPGYRGSSQEDDEKNPM